jgi:glucose-1-phosphate thymidylyltransferase
MKGIILAGGSGSRLYPLTKAGSKQLLPVYDKPMIYYPLATLMLADIHEILIITTKEDNPRFIDLLGNGEHLGINISYKVQDNPGGLPEAFIIGEDFIGNDRVCLILGDNIFYSDRFINQHVLPNINTDKSVIFGCRVSDPERYGVVELDQEFNILSIEEKPRNPKSNFAVTGLYIFGSDVCQVAKNLIVSPRGELEIVDVIKYYLARGELKLEALGRGIAWLDTGTHESLLDAANFIEVLENIQGLKISCIEEIAYQKGWISDAQLESIAISLRQNSYGKYLMSLLNN